METVSQNEQFQSICRSVDLGSASYLSIAPAVLVLFAQTLDFTAMHAVTATHAFRIIGKFCDDRNTAAFDLFVAIAAAYITIRAPKINALVTKRTVSCPELFERAIASDDDHIPKIVYTSYEEFKFSDEPLYLDAAERYVEKLSKS